MASRIERSLPSVTQQIADRGESDVDILLVDEERRRETDGALARAEEQHALPKGAEYDALHERRILELDRDHQPSAADVADRLRFRLQLTRLRDENVAHRARVLHVFLFDEVQSRERGRAAHRITAEGRAVRTRLPLHEI